jgi:hypothetical protein
MARHAVIYRPLHTGADRWERECATLCQQRRWPVVAVTANPANVGQMLDRGHAQVAVVARRSHAIELLDALPQIELVDRRRAPQPRRPSGDGSDRHSDRRTHRS